MFQKTRLKLTAWYLLIITIICFSLSGVIFRIQMNEVDRFAKAQRMRIERQYVNRDVFPPKPPQIDPDLFAETENRLLINLLVLNGIIIIFQADLVICWPGKLFDQLKKCLMTKIALFQIRLMS